MNLFFFLLLANVIPSRSKSVDLSKSRNIQEFDDMQKLDELPKSGAGQKFVVRSKSSDQKESVVHFKSETSLSCLTLQEFNSIYLQGLEVSKFEDAVNHANLLGVGGTSVVYRLKMNIEKLNKIETVTVAAKILNNGDISDQQFYDEIEKMNNAQNVYVGCVPLLYTCIYDTQENNPLINEQQEGQRNTKFEIARHLRVIIMESSLGDLGLSNLNSKPLLAYNSLSLSGKLYLFSKIAHCLSQFHTKKVIHGDIKGENILAMNEALTDVKFIDFSDVAAFGNQLQSGTTKYGDKQFLNLKASFKVNEVWNKPDTAHPGRDLYAFGMTIFYLEEKKSVFAQKIYKDFRENKETCNEQFFSGIETWLLKKNMHVCTNIKNKNDKTEEICVSQIMQKLLAVERKKRDWTADFVSRSFKALSEEAKRFEGSVGTHFLI